MKFICCCSGAKSCPTFCNTMDCSLPGFPILHHLLEFTETHVHWVSDAIQPSHPLSPPSRLTLNLSQHQDLFQRVSSSHQVAKVLELQYKVNKPAYCVPYIFTKALSPQSFDVNTCAINHILLFVTQYFPNTNRACTGLDLGFIGSLKKDILKDTDVHDLNLGMGFTGGTCIRTAASAHIVQFYFQQSTAIAFMANCVLKYIEHLNMYM